MWIEQIEIYKNENPFIKINAPSDEKEIKAAEEALGVSFPNELKGLLLELDGDSLLLFSALQIVTRKALGGLYGGFEEPLSIGGNGCGDYYAYTITDGITASNEIIRWEHEDNSRVFVASGLAGLIEKYHADQV